MGGGVSQPKGGERRSSVVSKREAEVAGMLVEEVKKQQQRNPEALDCETLEDARREIKRIRLICRLVPEEDLQHFLDEKGLTLSSRAKLQEAEENRALGVIMVVKEKMSKRFVSMREAFAKMDVDNSGLVDKDEFLMACQFWGLLLEEEDLRLMLSYQNSDEDVLAEGVNYKAFLDLLTLGTDQCEKKEGANDVSDEMLTIASKLRDSLKGEASTLRNAFELVDSDKSGYISAREMMDVLKKFHIDCSKDALYAFFDAYDANQDNSFSYEEFARFFEENNHDATDKVVTQPSTSQE